jgi:hypothetical protein
MKTSSFSSENYCSSKNKKWVSPQVARNPNNINFLNKNENDYLLNKKRNPPQSVRNPDN